LHLEVLIGAIGEELRASRPEVGQARDVLLRRKGSSLLLLASFAVSFLIRE